MVLTDMFPGTLCFLSLGDKRVLNETDRKEESLLTSGLTGRLFPVRWTRALYLGLAISTPGHGMIKAHKI